MKTIGLINAACSLDKGGANFALICTNTRHKLYDEVQKSNIDPLAAHSGCNSGSHKSDGMDKIGLLVKQEDSSVPLFDTTEIHVKSAVRHAPDKCLATPSQYYIILNMKS